MPVREISLGERSSLARAGEEVRSRAQVRHTDFAFMGTVLLFARGARFGGTRGASWNAGNGGTVRVDYKPACRENARLREALGWQAPGLGSRTDRAHRGREGGSRTMVQES